MAFNLLELPVEMMGRLFEFCSRKDLFHLSCCSRECERTTKYWLWRKVCIPLCTREETDQLLGNVPIITRFKKHDLLKLITKKMENLCFVSKLEFYNDCRIGGICSYVDLDAELDECISPFEVERNSVIAFAQNIINNCSPNKVEELKLCSGGRNHPLHCIHEEYCAPVILSMSLQTFRKLRQVDILSMSTKFGWLKGIGSLPLLKGLSITSCIIQNGDIEDISKAERMETLVLNSVGFVENFSWSSFGHLNSLQKFSSAHVIFPDIDDIKMMFFTSGLQLVPHLQILSVENSGFDDSCLRMLQDITINSLCVSDCDELTNHSFQYLSSLSCLQCLDISSNSNVDDETMCYIVALRMLVELNISYTSVTDKGVHVLFRNVKSSIRKFKIQHSGITDDGLLFICDNTELLSLDISQNDFSLKGMLYLCHLESLECLDITEIDDPLFGKNMHLVLLKLKNLKVLNLGGTRITDGGIALLRDLQTLKEIDLTNTSLSDLSMVYIWGFASLQKLVVFSVSGIGDDSLRFIGKLVSLRQLDISYTKVTDNGMGYIGKLRLLEDLDICGCVGITDSCLGVFNHLLCLQHLILNGTSITREGEAFLHCLGIHT